MPFLRKMMLFLIAPLMMFLMLTGGLVMTGESMPLPLVIRMQDNDTPVLFRPKYGNLDQRYKRLAVDYYQPNVLVIGSSRVLQFRAQFLNRNPDAFYNGAAPAWQLPEIATHLDSINHRPDIILLGIDDAWFNVDYGGDPIVEPPVSDYARLFIVNRSFLQEVLAGESFDISRLLARSEPGGSGGLALGFRAIMDGHGFRNDGSEQYGDFLVARYLWPPNTRAMHTGWFEQGLEMYVPGADIDPQAMSQMRHILDYAAENDILLIGFSPPYMPSLWEKIAVSERHTYIPALVPQLQSLFAEYGFPYFDFHDGALLGAMDDDFFDGWHHSEKVATQIYINIAHELPALQAYSDLDALQQIIDSAPDTFSVFPFVAD